MNINSKKISIFGLLLIVFILIGIFFRIHNLNYPFYVFDDQIFAVSSLKIHHQSWEAGVSYVWNHPPLGKYVLGVFTIFMPDSQFQILNSIPAQMFGWGFLAYEALGKTILLLRTSSLLFGLLIILFSYLILSKIYSVSAGLWAAVFVSLSLDFISFSRNLYPEHLMNFFTLLCLYFYISYAYTSKKKIPSLFGFFISLIFLVNSRQFQPILIATMFLFHYALLNFSKTKSIIETFKKIIPILIVYGLTTLLTFLFIYNPLPPSEFTHSTLLAFGFQIIKLIEILIFRNSYLALFGLALACGWVIFYRKKILTNFKKFSFSLSYLTSLKALLPVLFLLSFISFLPFNFPYYSLSRWSSFILLFFLLAIAPIFSDLEEKKKKWFTILAIIFLLIASYQIYEASKDHPPFILNANFNAEKYPLMPDTYGTGYNYSIYSYFSEINNPPVVTNLGWFSTFYEGEILFTPLPNTDLCSNQYFEYLKNNNVRLLVRYPDFFTKEPWASCEEFRQQNFSLEKEFQLVGKENLQENKTINVYMIKQ